jgi:hypothetical protein
VRGDHLSEDVAGVVRGLKQPDTAGVEVLPEEFQVGHELSLMPSRLMAGLVVMVPQSLRESKQLRAIRAIGAPTPPHGLLRS